jgi:hypothetical protein
MATLSKQVKSTTNKVSKQCTQTRIQICISHDLHEKLVISRLVSHYTFTVKMAAVQMDENVSGDSCLVLELQRNKVPG